MGTKVKARRSVPLPAEDVFRALTGSSFSPLDGEPPSKAGLRSNVHENYYAAFVLDPDKKTSRRFARSRSSSKPG
jgi:hypothetical protein